jgi:hypothetical protein
VPGQRIDLKGEEERDRQACATLRHPHSFRTATKGEP